MSASSEGVAPARAAAPARRASAVGALRAWPVALVAALTLLVATLGWLSPAPVALDVGSPLDGAYLSGFHEREAGGPGRYRWAREEAQIRLPAVRGPAALELRMVGRDGGSPLQLSAGADPRAELLVAAATPRRYLLLWDGAAAPTVALRSPGTPPAGPDDPRRLAVIVERAALRPLAGRAAPPPGPLAALGATALLALAGLRLAGAPPRAALACALAAGAALAAGWGWARLWVAPFLLPTLAGAAALVALLAAARAGARRRPVGAPELVLILAAASALIPIYLFQLYGHRDWASWQNWPLLLLPIGLGGLWLRGRPRQVALGLALLLAAGYAAGMARTILITDYGRDFHAIYGGVADFLAGEAPLYDLPVIADNPLTDRYKYPPQFAVLFAPFALPPFGAAFTLWRLANLALLGLAALALLRAYGLRLRSWPAAGLLLIILTLRPIADTLRYGQVDLPLLALMALALRDLARGRDWAWGAWVGVAAALKLYPAYLLGLALARRSWRPVAGAALAALALTLLSVAAFGWEIHRVFLSQVLGATGVGTTWVENQTVGGLISRLLSPERVALEPDRGALVRLAGYAWAAALTALTLWLTRPAAMRADLAYGLWVTAMLLALPVAWMHYQVVLVIPLLQALVLAAERPGGLPWPAVACYALAWGLLAHGNLWTFYGSELYGPYWQLILSYKLFGLLLLYAAQAMAGRATPPAPPAGP